MDIRKIKKLIELIEESDIAEIEIHEGEESVRLSRASAVAPVYSAAPAPMPAAAPASAPSAVAAEATPSVSETEELTGHVV